jgi:hypothetical protein
MMSSKSTGENNNTNRNERLSTSKSAVFSVLTKEIERGYTAGTWILVHPDERLIWFHLFLTSCSERASLPAMTFQACLDFWSFLRSRSFCSSVSVQGWQMVGDGALDHGRD